MLWEYGLRGSLLLRDMRSLCIQNESCEWILWTAVSQTRSRWGLASAKAALSPILFVIFMDRKARRSRGRKGMEFDGQGISLLLLAVDVVLMASLVCALQHSLDLFTLEI